MSFSPNTSRGSPPVSARLQFGPVISISTGSLGVSRLRSSSTKKPPEPLRRAVVDCLSSSSPTHHGCSSSSSTITSEASRILRDYLAAPSTIDLAYNVIIEHTIAERERSPAVIVRCVALLKRHLLRYRPGQETLLQINRFCMTIIAECDPFLSHRLTQCSGTLIPSVESTSMTNSSAPLPVSSFASATLIKSLNYVRSLVAQQIPKRSFQPAAFAGTASASKHALPALSSLLKKSFNSQMNAANVVEPSEGKDDATLSSSNQFNLKKVDFVEDRQYIAVDALNWRWLREHHDSRSLSESDRIVYLQDTNTHNFLEVGAAALLVGGMESKMKGQSWKYFGSVDMPYLEQLLQPSPDTTIASSGSSNSHLRAITTSKRTKAGPRQIWEELPVGTFRPRARPLFQYRHYSEQQPLRLNPTEVCEVIAAVCSQASSPNTSSLTVSLKLTNNRKPSIDAAVSVLIKLVIDMYMLDPGVAAPLNLSMLQEMLCSSRTDCRTRAFDLILNLGVHAQLLEPVISDVTATIEEEYSQESCMNNDSQLETEENTKSLPNVTGSSAAIVDFETWILNILHETLLFLVQIEEKEEPVWAAGLSCLLYFVCSRGKISRQRLQGLDIRVVKSLLEISRRNSWAEIVHCKLISMLTNMFYQLPSEPADSVSSAPVFLVDQVDLIGGIEFIFLEYSLANSREERRNLYLVLFDYVLHQINETYLATGVSEYSDDEIQPLATLLSLVDAPEAFYISVKLGVQGLGEILRRSISDALSRYPNRERLNMLLEHITERFDLLVSSYTRLDKEFSHMVQLTKSFKRLWSIEEPFVRNAVHLYWSTLHSLLHSPRIGCRQNGYIWLNDLLISEISYGKDADIWSNIEILQQGITSAGVTDLTTTSNVSLPILLFCGLLKSKSNAIRWGFLFILDRLLMRCKFLLDERQLQSSSSDNNERVNEDSHLMKANAVIDIMSSAMLLVFQINETDRINILKMCDILFSQVCLKVPPTNSGEGITTESNIVVGETLFKRQKSRGDLKINSCESSSTSSVFSGTASMAALLLQGHAVVPMQLISRIPAALFYWPLIQLASAVTDNIALGVAVGSKGRGNLPGAASDIRSTLLLLLIGKCTVDPCAFLEVGGEEFFRRLLDDTDSRVAYYSSAFLLKRMMTEKPEKYQHMLQNLVFKAQQNNNEKLLENPYLQMRGILQLANDLGIEM